ncbi:MAG: PIG-L family deacetylase [Candidatus Omnitrophica bacterium]|nr:PIG-L family deacetylase [Candidatus Omnitrophota bacterium]
MRMVIKNPKCLFLVLLVSSISLFRPEVSMAEDKTVSNDPIRIMVIGAHPDDCEIKAGGVAAKWAEQGHKVKFVSVTNGDIGHYEMAGGPLAQRRMAEVEEAAKVLGIETQVLDHHDGELMPTLEIRKELIRLIREWEADIVITHRPNDYHPDHRYTSILVQDGAYMVAVPFICPDTPPLDSNPVYLYLWDHFQKPTPFQADIVVAIDDVIEKKLEALSVIDSQFAEWLPWIGKYLDDVPKDPEGAKGFIKERFKPYIGKTADSYREELAKWYGKDAAASVEYAEAFEICEYGRQPSDDEIRELFPFFGETDKSK